MRKEITNKSASVLAKLQSVARIEDVDPNLIVIRYCQEKFLYRLSISKYSGNFCLKGGLLLIYLDVPNTRPTKDIDFLAKQISNGRKNLESIVADIAILNCDDSIRFLKGSITSEEIVETDDEPGIRVKIPALIGKAEVSVKLDFGWGDIVKPGEQEIDFPTILSDELRPKLNVYSTESIVSEKFEAAVDIGITNSRMKDFYDIYVLSLSQNFKANHLREAIVATFKNRETNLSNDLYIFRPDFSQEETRQKQWLAFLQKHKLKNVPQDFAQIMTGITALLKPLVVSIFNKKEIDGS